MKATKDDFHSDGRPYTQEEFINRIKTDDEFAKKWGELGPIYGKQWRRWNVPRMEPKGFDFDTAFEKSQKIWESTNGMECGPSFETFCMSLLRSKNMGISYGYHTQVDQIANLINELKTNPDSRRLMVSAWNVGELDQMVLPPCHYGFQCYTRELSRKERADYYYNNGNKEGIVEGNLDRPIWKDDETAHKWYDERNVPKRALSLMWSQRSVDTFLGLPFNIASYGLLLEIIAKAVNMVPDQLIGNLGDVHLYSNHVEQAKEQIGRTPYESPTLNINTEFWPYEGGECGVGHLDAVAVFKSFADENFCKCLLEEDIQLCNYQSHPTIKAPLSN